jgi:hypothetical protein
VNILIPSNNRRGASMNVDVAVIIKSHLTWRAEGRRSDLVGRSGSGVIRTKVSLATRT